MSELMSRIKVTIHLSDPIKRAIGIYAAENNLNMGDVIAEMVRDYIPEHVKQAEQAIAAGVPKMTRKGKPPKSKPT